jgi:hypothetical protein
MTDDEEARIEMSTAFAATDEGLAAFLSGLVDSVLRCDALKPADGDTPKAERIKALGRAYRDPLTEMLNRLSGLDEMHAAIQRGEPMWPSQNALGEVLVRTWTLGIEVAEFVAPHRELTDEESEALADEIEDMIENNPEVKAVIEQYQRLHPEADA